VLCRYAEFVEEPADPALDFVADEGNSGSTTVRSDPHDRPRNQASVLARALEPV
jgi:hypothetical protein